MILLSYPFRPLIIVKGDAKRAFTGMRWMSDSKTIAQKNNRAPNKKFDLQNEHFEGFYSLIYLLEIKSGGPIITRTSSIYLLCEFLTFNHL